MKIANCQLPIANCLLLPIAIGTYCLLLLASCEKNTTAPAAFSYSLNGNEVSGSHYSAFYHYDTVSNLQVFQARFYTGDSGSNKFMQLNFISTNYILTGSYTYGIHYPDSTTGSLALVNDSVQYMETSGSFQISQIDTIKHQLSGKFQMAAVNSIDSFNAVSVTNGVFTNLSYKIQ